MDILLPQIYRIDNPEQYKLHLASYNQEFEPLDVFVRDRKDWDGWSSYRASRDEFSRNYIFALIDFYPQKDIWLFGGAYEVISRQPINHSRSYKIELIPECKPYVGRLKISFKRPGRPKVVNFENYYKGLVVAELLPEPYSGEAFCGYDQIDIPFTMLENIVKIQRQDWKAALENAKGVYLITDKSNGKRYVGSAYGETGIWSRWSCYVGTGHGHDDEFSKIIDTHGIDYARQHFQFALLEHRTPKTDDNVVIQREKYWKGVLLTRGDYGYNKN